MESSFMLSPDSRIPLWFTLPAGKQRLDVSVQMDYYSGADRRTATVRLLDAQNRRTLDSVVARLQGDEPLTLGPPHEMGRPMPYPSSLLSKLADGEQWRGTT
jgi:hypothetical protein